MTGFFEEGDDPYPEAEQALDDELLARARESMTSAAETRQLALADLQRLEQAIDHELPGLRRLMGLEEGRTP